MLGLTLDQEIAIGGTAVGVVGLVLAVLFRSRRLKASIEFEEATAVVVVDYPFLGERHVGGHYIVVTVTNLGDRPITITSVELNRARQNMKRDIVIQPSERFQLPIAAPDSRTFDEPITVVLTTSDGRKIKGRGWVKKTDIHTDPVTVHPWEPKG